MPIKLRMIVVFLAIAGCSGEPERSRVVRPSTVGTPESAETGLPVTKNPRRIEMH